VHLIKVGERGPRRRMGRGFSKDAISIVRAASRAFAQSRLAAAPLCLSAKRARTQRISARVVASASLSPIYRGIIKRFIYVPSDKCGFPFSHASRALRGSRIPRRPLHFHSINSINIVSYIHFSLSSFRRVGCFTRALRRAPLLSGPSTPR
jgi:hypothetical protein